MRPRGLTYSVIMTLVPVALVLVGLLGVTNYFAAKGQILKAVDREIDVRAGMAADSLAGFFKERQRDARSLSDAGAIRDYLKNLEYGLREEAETYRKELNKAFARLAAREGVYRRIVFSDAGGKALAVFVEAGPEPAPAPALALPADLVRGQLVATHAPGTEIPTGYIAGVFDDDGRLRGSVELTWKSDALKRILIEAQPGTVSRVELTTLDGTGLLAAGQPLPGALSTQTRVSGTDYGVRLMADPAEFLQPLERVLQWIFGLSLFAGTMIFIWIGLSLRRSIQPIEEMAEGTKRLAAGDLDYRFAESPIRELRTLGDAFNEMAARLRERNLQLRSRIRELTALRDVDAAVTQRLDEEPILRACLKAVTEGLDFDRAGLYWVETNRGQITGRFVHGSAAPPEEAFRKRRVLLGGVDILNQAVEGREAYLVKDPGSEPRLNQEFVAESRTPEFVVAPICGKDRVFGLITADTVSSRRPLSEADRESLTLFANAVGLALENAVLLRDLARSEARYRAVLENSPVAVVGLSEEHWIATWNRGAEELFGWRAAEVSGKPVTVLFPAAEAPDFNHLLAALMERGAVREYALGGRSKDGRRLDLSVSWGGAHPDFWTNKEWTLVIRDVSEAKKLQKQLIQSEKLSAAGRLISGIAHELNSPLSAIMGFAHFAAAEGGGGPRLKQDLKDLHTHAANCRKIIENLLMFVRTGSVPKAPLRLAEAVEASVKLLEHRLEKVEGLKVKTSLAARLPAVTGDLQQLEQVFINLINNACDAMALQRGEKRLVIAARAENGWVRVSVTDNGPGMPPDVRARAFEPFFTTKAEGQGTGLGLATCRQIIEDHGGTMGVDPGEGGGTRFWFDLPATAGKPARRRKAAPEARAAAGASVLVVDDEPALRGVYKRLLEAEGLKVVAAASLEEALAAGAKQAFDLVLTDLHLGHHSGLELYDQWTERCRGPRPPMLFLTGDVLNDALEGAAKTRGVTLLLKPLEMPVLRQAIAGVLAGKRA